MVIDVVVSALHHHHVTQSSHSINAMLSYLHLLLFLQHCSTAAQGPAASIVAPVLLRLVRLPLLLLLLLLR
jgi:hypothetical protein